MPLPDLACHRHGGSDHCHSEPDHRHGGSDHCHSEPDHRHNRQGMLPSGAEGVRFCGTPSATIKDKTLLYNLLQNSTAEGGQYKCTPSAVRPSSDTAVRPASLRNSSPSLRMRLPSLRNSSPSLRMRSAIRMCDGSLTWESCCAKMENHYFCIDYTLELWKTARKLCR